uniref:V-type proton ATPase subunit S1/VOA1 transmembrane domain-containing protein n=1 Tax=Globodera rostochiensis TaxID=31243 RepID=A0A914HUE4_GLORO
MEPQFTFSRISPLFERSDLDKVIFQLLKNSKMLIKLATPTALYSCVVVSLSFFLSSMSAVRMDDAEQTEQRPTGDTSSRQFPISYPPIKFDEKAFVEKPKGSDRCLFYAEGLSVVVFNSAKSQSAWANYRSDVEGSTAKYTASMDCQGNQNFGSSFDIYLKIDGKMDGIVRADIGKQDAKSAFTVDGAEFVLHFNFTQVGYWKLVGATVTRITVSKSSSDFLNKNLDVDSKWALEKSVVGASNIYGFKDYSFACGQTNPIVWKSSSDVSYAVGITLNNVQFQPFNATFMDGGKEADFLNIGTWMGLVVALLLIGVLSFGFLMLNSVQTMDRFDDPKQKQLIISSKE